MTIKFVCTCGKHLKARDEMAARRSVCPRCGSPVGIPSLKPTHAGTMAPPLTPPERMRLARQRAPMASPATAPAADSPPKTPARRLDSRLVHLLSTRTVRRPDLTGRHLEKHWYQCLAYPLRAWRLCTGLTLFLTVLSAGIALVLPHLLAEPQSDSLMPTLVRLCCLPLLVLIFGVPCSFFDCVLASAVAGEVYYILWSGSPVLAVLRSGVKWLTCLLAGPIVFAAAGVLYWLRCGDPVLLDWLILIELGMVGITYWFFTVLSLTDGGRLRDLNPLAVADMAHRPGWRALAVTLGGALVLLLHGWLILSAVAEVHTAPAPGLLLLTGAWLSGIYWSTFFCRLLGVWCHRSRLAVDG
jgi:hypothetical protein